MGGGGGGGGGIGGKPGETPNSSLKRMNEQILYL